MNIAEARMFLLEYEPLIAKSVVVPLITPFIPSIATKKS